jgi:hypothetical protein
MSLCAYCGQSLPEGRGLCPHHSTGHGDDWATGNRIMCDFVHRGIVLFELRVDGLEMAVAA